MESTEEAAEARLKGVFDEYKEFEAKYVQKYRGQNRLVITDFNVFNNSMTQYLSPWKLFCEIEGYNSFGTADLFYDYGPKMFIEMLGENDAIVPTNTQFIPPVLSWGGNNYVYYLGAQLEGKENGQKVLFDVEFPLNITENETTLEIPGISKDGEMYYPSLISSFGMSAYCTSKPWVLKKGWNGGSAKASMPYTRSGMKAMAMSRSLGWRDHDGHRRRSPRYPRRNFLQTRDHPQVVDLPQPEAKTARPYP